MDELVICSFKHLPIKLDALKKGVYLRLWHNMNIYELTSGKIVLGVYNHGIR